MKNLFEKLQRTENRKRAQKKNQTLSIWNKTWCTKLYMKKVFITLQILHFYFAWNFLQTEINFFLSSDSHTLDMDTYIWGGGGGSDIRSMSSIRPICKCRCPPLDRNIVRQPKSSIASSIPKMDVSKSSADSLEFSVTILCSKGWKSQCM